MHGIQFGKINVLTFETEIDVLKKQYLCRNRINSVIIRNNNNCVFAIPFLSILHIFPNFHDNNNNFMSTLVPHELPTF